MAGIFLVKGDI